ncbi:hypothetical protein [Streptomyces sp. NBS 14/10]|uniref:hypothetical protein n=1 Tax=Streptomyces sp. NBS 14/10 TaxID=1945643 RepID=UPI00351D5650
MPTPYGSRGGMAFSADELRVLRRALAIALQPHPVTLSPGHGGPDRTEEVQECLRLAEAVDEAVREGGRLRAFLLDELARYRAALPGAAVGYLDQLEGVLAAGYEPLPEDLAALRQLCRSAAGTGEAERRRALLRHCERLAERGVRTRLAERAAGALRAREGRSPAVRLRVLPGGAPAGGARVAQKNGEPGREPRRKPSAPDRGGHEEPGHEEPGHGEPAQGEPKQAGPKRAAPKSADPVLADPNREEPKREEQKQAAPKPSAPKPSDPKPSDPRQSDPEREKPKQGEPKQSEPAKGEPKQSEPKKAEPSKGEPKKGEPKRAEPTRAEPTRGEPTRGEPKRGEPGRGEPGRAEPGRRAPRPGRPVPTPAEVFPPKRRRPAQPPEGDSRLGRVPA